MRERGSSARLRRKLISLAVASCLATEFAWANPTGPSVVAGAATFSGAGSSLTVTNTPNAIINWRGFSIGAGEITRFQQQSASSAVLNRVVGQDPSAILGTLWSNGKVFLVNPNGILFGQGSRIDVGGLVASTLNITDADFLGGRLNFQAGAIANSIVNQGELHSASGGNIYLIAPDVTNSGLISSPTGEVILAAGRSVSLVDVQTPNLKVEVSASAGEARNLGRIVADSGRIGVYAGLINQQGIVRADSVTSDATGRIIFKASDTTLLEAGSVTSASGAKGGEIQVLGNRVGVTGNAIVDASGASGGGNILVGGDYGGANPEIQNSSNTFIGSSATLRADATHSGDGGRIIVWSDDKTQFYGNLSARGGPEAGNGGFAEISGKQGLVFAGRADLGAPNGRPGDLLLDPLDLYVFAGGGIDPTIIDEVTDFPSSAATVSPATLAATAGSVTLQASRYMRISDPIALTTPGQGLTATVGVAALPIPLALSSVPNQLDLGANISTAGGAVSLSAPSIQAVGGVPQSISTAGGAIGLNAAGIIGAANLSLNAGGGPVTATSASGLIVLGSVTANSFTANAVGSVSTAGITASGGGAVNVTSSSGTVAPGTIATTGPVSLSGASVSGTVNDTSSLTATASGAVAITSSTNLNVANVTSTTSSVNLATTGGSILPASPGSTVSGLDVSLLTAAGTGGGIGTAGTALNVDVQRNFTFRPNGDFNILLTGTGPNSLNAQLTPAAIGTYSGTLARQGGGLTLNASADTSTVTLSSLNITSGFDQMVSLGAPSISVQTTNNANLVATSVTVPTGDTVATGPGHTEAPLPVTLSSNGTGNLTVTSYTRAGGGLAKTTTFSSGSGSVMLGTVNASKDFVGVIGPAGITVNGLTSTGNVVLAATSGSVNAQNDSAGAEISSGGSLIINARGIGTSAFTNPLDLEAATIDLASAGGGAGPIGGANPVIANTPQLTVNARSGSTFNVSTGAAVLTDLTVSASPVSVGPGGLAQVSTSGDLYVFASNGANFTFNPPVSTGRNIAFMSTVGDINLGATSVGTGNLFLAAEGGAISAGQITASTGNIALASVNGVTTGALDTAGQVAIGLVVGGFPSISTGPIGAVTPPSEVNIGGPTVTTGPITAAGNVFLSAQGGMLTVGGALTTADGNTVALTSNGGSPFQFTTINAGATGTVNIVSPAGIQQTADGAGTGITAKNVGLSAIFGPIENTADAANARLDLLGTTNLAVDAGGVARFDTHGGVLADLSITKRAIPAGAPFELANLGGGQALSIASATEPFEVSLNSPTPLNFALTQAVPATNLTLVGGGIASGGGNVILTSQSGIGCGVGCGPITSGAGSVSLLANNGSISIAGISTAGGSVNATAFGGPVVTSAISTGGGPIALQTNESIDISGDLIAGAGTISMSAGTSISRSGAFNVSSATSVSASTLDGDIGTAGSPLLITSPTVNLSAGRSVGVPAGHAFATLTGTANLTLHGDSGFNVSTDTALATVAVSTRGTGTSALSLTAPTQTYVFARPGAGAFEVVSVNAPPATAAFTATDGALLVRGDGTNKLNVQNLTLASTNAGDIVLQGDAANPLILNQPTQTFNAGTGDLFATGQISISGASQTFSTSGPASTMIFQGGSAAGEKIIIASTQDQLVLSTSFSADAYKLVGGSGADSSVTFTHSGAGAQTFQMLNGTLTVAGGSGTNSFAKLEETGTGAQRICFLGIIPGCLPILSLNVLGGSGTGAFAQITSAGSQDIRVSGVAANTGTTVMGGTGDGSHALIQAGTSQFLGGGGRMQVKAGPANNASARIAAGGPQTLSVGNLSLVAGGTEIAPLQGASAIIEGGNQTISALAGGITLNAGAGVANGSTSDALLRNLSGGQSVNTTGTLVVDGGHQFSTAGILNLGTGTQTVASSGGITLRSDADFANPHSDAIVAIQNQRATMQTIGTAGPLKLTNSGGGTVNITTAGDQRIFAQYVEVLTNPTAEAGPNSASISAGGNQQISTNNLAATGFPSLRVAALGSGTASVESGGSQLIELDYHSQMQATNRDGRLIIGDVNALGTSRLRASGDQAVFARSITVQGGLSNSVSELKAGGTQFISTLQGGVDVIGGLGNDSLAQIDPGLQTILANGSVNIIGGDGVNSLAQIIAATFGVPNGQTIYTTSGNVALVGGAGPGADAIIANSTGSSLIHASGGIVSSSFPGGGGTVICCGQVFLEGGNVGLPAVVAGTGNISVVSQGAITQSGPIGAAGGTFSAGSNSITLDHPANDFSGPVNLSGGAVAIADANALTLGSVTASALNVTAGGAVGQSAPIAVSGVATFAAGAALTLTHTANAFGGPANLSGGSVSINNTTALDLGTVNASSLSVTSAGPIAQSGPATVSGASSFAAGANAITLTNVGNDFGGAVSLGGSAVTINDVNSLTLGLVNAGSLTVNATAISQDASGIVVSGGSTFGAGTGGITLASVANDFGGAVNLTGGAVSIADTNALQLGAINAASLNAVANGAITQSAEAVRVTGASSFNAGANAINLTNAANDFGGAAALTGGAVSITDTNALTLGAVNASSLNVTADGAIAQVAATTLTATGAASFNAGPNAITLTNPNDFAGAVALTGGAVSITDTNALTLGAVNASSLDLAAGGAVTQAAATTLTTTGAASFFAGTNAITLTNSNDFGGAVSLTGGAVSITDTNALDLGGVMATSLNVTAGGAITQAPATMVTTIGASSFNAGASAITLANAANDFGDAVSLTGGAVSVIDTNALVLGVVSASSLNVVTGGAITQAAPGFGPGGTVAVTGVASFDAGTSAIALANASNDFGGTVNLTGGAVSIADTNALVLGTVSGSSLSVAAGGAITQTAPGTVAVTGAASFDAGANPITMASGANDFGGTVNLTGGAVSIADANALLLGLVNATSLTANGTSIAQDASGITVNGTLTLNAGTGPITLTATANDFVGAAALTGGAVSITDTNALLLGAVDVSSLNVTTGGPITQAAATTLTTTGAATFNAGANAITLANSANDFGGTVSLTGASASITDATALDLGAVSLGGGSLTVNAGPITQSGVITAGAATFNAGANAITLTNASNDFAGVSLTGGAVSLTDATALTLGTVDASSLSVVSNGLIFQSGPATVSGAASFDAGSSPIALTNAGNDFGGAVSLTTGGANTVSITDATALILGTVNASHLTVMANGAITQTGPITVANWSIFNAGSNPITLTNASNDFATGVNLTGSSASITDANELFLENVSLGGGSLTVNASGAIGSGPITAGAASFNAGSNPITLTSASNDFTGAVSLNGSTVSITDANALTLGAVNASSLTVNATSVDQNASGVVVNATATLNSGSIALTSATNDFATVVATSAGPVALTDANAITLGATSAASLSVSAGGAITQSGAITTAAASLNGASIMLANASNDFTGPVSLTGGSVSLTDANALNLGPTGASSLNVAAGGPITQSGAATVSGNSTFAAGANPITLTNAANDFGGTVSLTGSAAAITDSSALVFGTVSLGNGGLSASASGAITQTGPITAGASLFNAGSNSIILTSAANDFTGPLALIGGAVSITDANLLTLAAVNASSLSLASGTLDQDPSGVIVSGTTTLNVANITLASAPNSFATVDIAGTLDTSGGTFSAATVNVLPGATLKGTGTITGSVNNSGTLAPGASPGTLTVNGNFVQAPGGVLNMEIGGRTAGTFDQLVVNGSATLGGSLVASSFGGFAFAAGDSFQLVQSGGALTGTFASVAPPLGTVSTSFYGPTLYTLNVTSVGTPPALQSAINYVVGVTQPPTVPVVQASPVPVTLTTSTTTPALAAGTSTNLTIVAAADTPAITEAEITGTPSEKTIGQRPPPCTN